MPDIGVAVSVNVTGTTAVVLEPSGQLVTVGGQEVIIYILVE